MFKNKQNEIVYQIKTAVFTGKIYLALKYIDLAIDKVTEEFFAENYKKIYTQKAKFGNGMPSALFYTWDNNGTTDIAIAVPIIEKPKVIAQDFKLIEIAKNKSIYIDYYGSYADMEPAHTALNNYIMENNLKGDYVAIEEYVTDPAAEPDPSKWLTKITYVKLNN